MINPTPVILYLSIFSDRKSFDNNRMKTKFNAVMEYRMEKSKYLAQNDDMTGHATNRIPPRTNCMENIFANNVFFPERAALLKNRFPNAARNATITSKNIAIRFILLYFPFYSLTTSKQ